MLSWVEHEKSFITSGPGWLGESELEELYFQALVFGKKCLMEHLKVDLVWSYKSRTP